jgi:hypothetical protein
MKRSLLSETVSVLEANRVKQQQLYPPNIAGNERQIQAHDQDHTEGRYALQNITDLSNCC